jgi:hypothetical protein
MIQRSALALLIAIGVPTLAVAQAPTPPGAPHKPPPRRVVAPPGAGIPHPPPRIGGPRGAPGPVVFRGRSINRVHLAPFVYPHGWAYRRWAVGAILPPLFLAPAYYYADWATLGLDPPPAGFQWVRYGPDLLLVNVTTGAVTDTVYGVFY